VQSSDPTVPSGRSHGGDIVIERRPIRRSQADSVSRPATSTVQAVAMTTMPAARAPGAMPALDWRAVAAGALTACGVLLFLGLLGLAVGLTAFNAATAAAQNALPGGFGRAFGIWAALCSLLAFLAGGYVAARYTHDRPGHAARQAAMAFLAVCPLLLALLLGGLAGAAGGVAGAVAGLQADPAAAVRANPTAVGDAATQVRDATWGALAAVVLGLIGSIMGSRLAGGQADRPARRPAAHRERHLAWDSDDWPSQTGSASDRAVRT
jgi:hypothetical protein